MSINEIYPMRKRRSINKTPGKTPTRSSTNCNEGRVIQQTPKRITSNSSFSECEIVWDNHSPSPSRTLLRKRKKKTVSDESSSDNNDIADLVKKLADKTGQTPQDSSLYNFWFNEQEPQAENQSTNNNKTTSSSKKKHLQTPARRPRVLRKSRKSKNRLTKELEMLASMMKNTAQGNILRLALLSQVDKEMQ
ncbi:hypothetical protein QZH41_009021 [Actinostola sp. cb2023]|nr:hypothetical protein QZH41_009021 [Actinostola sp. cb2023]